MTDSRPHRVIVMGVSAVGKSTVGAALASHVRVPFLDGDDFHSPESVSKMARGQSLDDSDRTPWLHTCGRVLADEPRGAVLACSALARRYRDILVSECPEAVFVHLAADIDRITARAMRRTGHFMPTTLLRSQYDTLEPLAAGEAGFEVDADQDVADIVSDIRRELTGARFGSTSTFRGFSPVGGTR